MDNPDQHASRKVLFRTEESDGKNNDTPVADGWTLTKEKNG